MFGSERTFWSERMKNTHDVRLSLSTFAKRNKEVVDLNWISQRRLRRAGQHLRDSGLFLRDKIGNNFPETRLRHTVAAKSKKTSCPIITWTIGHKPSRAVESLARSLSAGSACHRRYEVFLKNTACISRSDGFCTRWVEFSFAR